MRTSQVADQLLANPDLSNLESLNSCVGSMSVEEYFQDEEGNLYVCQVRRIDRDEYPF